MNTALTKQTLLMGLPTMFTILVWVVFYTLAIDGWGLYLALVVAWIVTAGNLSVQWDAYETKLRLGQTKISQVNFALAVSGRYILVPIAMLIMHTTARQYDVLFPGWPTLLAGVVTYYLVYGVASNV